MLCDVLIPILILILPGRRNEGQTASRKALGVFSRQGALPA